MKLPTLIILGILLTGCNMKTQQKTLDYSNFLELHKHQGTENYEVNTIVPKNEKVYYTVMDTVENRLINKAIYKSLDKKEVRGQTLKADQMGTIINTFKAGVILEDGTLWDWKYYCNWIINGDTTKHEYIYPLSEDERKDPEKWLSTFKELYDKASYVYEFSWEYFFKINNKWYKMPYNLDVINDDFVNNLYPKKEDQDVRMVELPDLTPGFSIPPEKRDTSLIREVGYKSMFFEKIRKGMDRYNYSAGYWYLELYMPLGDTVKIRRYSDARNPRLSLHKIPAARGGRNDVVFVVLEPNEVHPEQAGGMYVIRPRDPDQPQHRYKSKTRYIYKGEVVSEEIIETEEYIRWKARNK